MRILIPKLHAVVRMYVYLNNSADCSAFASSANVKTAVTSDENVVHLVDDSENEDGENVYVDATGGQHSVQDSSVKHAVSDSFYKVKTTENVFDKKDQFYKRRLECLEKEHKIKVHCILAEHEIKMVTLKLDREIRELELKEMKRKVNL
ncbi:uncharacterized protein LOC126419124 [Schistocerca serialis cubense]|uniref:uncharacterized protein LOC126419124 n=1 Tax=Schistocerca serialis cubense TaxID=2023355 RepID=UPI00214E94D6|nr:uncharacterized protein LOC126419124 [Schistocerca serialis cubense]